MRLRRETIRALREIGLNKEGNPWAKDLALLILRLAGLGLAVGHGWGKLVSLGTGQGDRLIEGVAALGFPLPVLFAWALAEFAGGLFVAAGLASRWAAGFAAFTMAVAAFRQHHAIDKLLVGFGLLTVPAETVKSWGNPELALMYLTTLTSVALLGPGRFALDSLRRGKK